MSGSEGEANAAALRLDHVAVDEAFQIREGLNTSTVEHYRTILDQLPPIRVARLGERLVLLDGRHRMEAALREGRRELPAVVKELDERAALREAIRANAKNGLPLTLDERKGAAERLLRAFPDASNRSIAHDVGLSDKTVGEIRQELERTAEIPHFETRVGRDRKVRRMVPGRRPASPPLWRPLQPQPEEELLAPAPQPAEGTGAPKEPEHGAHSVATAPEAGATGMPAEHRERAAPQGEVKKLPGEGPVPTPPEAKEAPAEEPVAAPVEVASPPERTEPGPGGAATSAELLQAAARWLQKAADVLAAQDEDPTLRPVMERAAETALEVWEALKRRLPLKDQQELRDGYVQPLRRRLEARKAGTSSG